MSMIQKTDTLIPLTTPNLTEDQLASLSTSGKWLPRIQLHSRNSKACIKKLFPEGRYGLVSGNRITDLNEQFDCLPINVRAKAMDMRPKKPIAVFDPTSQQYQAIEATAKAGPNSKCTFGPEYLVYIPLERKFATFYFNNATMRRSAPDMTELLGKATTCSVEFVPSEEYGGWHGPVITACSTPLVLPDDRESFLATVKEQVENFLNESSAIEDDGEEDDAPTSGRAH